MKPIVLVGKYYLLIKAVTVIATRRNHYVHHLSFVSTAVNENNCLSVSEFCFHPHNNAETQKRGDSRLRG
ncbi:MAG: hypothetical protein R3Y58_13085 [Eubacteriales bacterium]